MIKILLVDDNEAQLCLMQEYFKSIECISITAMTSEPPVEYCDEFDCIIIDQYLSAGRHGLDFAMALKKHDWLKPIALLTGDGCLDNYDAKTIVDEVCLKEDILSIGIKLSAFIRQVKRIKHLKGEL